MAELAIRDVRTIITAPAGIDLVVVRVETTEPGLYGLGCATFTWRALAVRAAIDEYLRPLAIGRDPRRIEDFWQTAFSSAYWRSGPVQNNALSGVDMALWDIAGKLAGMPLYQLLGGKCREGAAVYRHADGAEIEEVEENARQFMAQGVRHIRCQLGGYGGKTALPRAPAGALPGVYFDPAGYARSVTRLFDRLRERIGFDVEFLHDIHERLEPIEAVRLAKELERHRLFFLEDALPPEHVEWFRMIRSQCTTPQAMGELFVNPQEWKPLVAERLIDFIRVHISAIGGITPAVKLARLCEAFGVRTAWHGPGDVSPVGHAANAHLDVACPNFGIQEWSGMSDELREVFPGSPEVREGYLYPSDGPGLGIDLDEKRAAGFPPKFAPFEWTLTRAIDGTAVRP